MKNAFLLCVSALMSHTVLAGSLMSVLNKTPDTIDELGQYRIIQHEDGLTELRARNINFLNLTETEKNYSSADDQEYFTDGWHRGEQSWNIMMVLANSDKDAVCKYYLGDQARYAGRFSKTYLRHVRYKLSFVSVKADGRFEISRAWGGKNLLNKVFCHSS